MVTVQLTISTTHKHKQNTALYAIAMKASTLVVVIALVCSCAAIRHEGQIVERGLMKSMRKAVSSCIGSKCGGGDGSHGGNSHGAAGQSSHASSPVPSPASHHSSSHGNSPIPSPPSHHASSHGSHSVGYTLESHSPASLSGTHRSSSGFSSSGTGILGFSSMPSNSPSPVRGQSVPQRALRIGSPSNKAKGVATDAQGKDATRPHSSSSSSSGSPRRKFAPDAGPSGVKKHRRAWREAEASGDGHRRTTY